MSIEWLGFAGIALCVLGYLPQVTHLIRERCSAGLSPGAYITWGVAALALLFYAIVRRDTVFVVLQVYHAGATAVIFYFCRKYRDRLCDEHGGPRHAG